MRDREESKEVSEKIRDETFLRPVFAWREKVKREKEKEKKDDKVDREL